MKSWQPNQIYGEMLASLLILLFVYTATDKWLHPAVFEASLAKSNVLAPFRSVLVYLIPMIEALTSIFLFLPRYRTTGFLLSALLLSLFSIYIIFMLLFQPQLPCSCGGIISTLGWQEHLFLNMVLSTLSLIAWMRTRNATALPNKSINALFE